MLDGEEESPIVRGESRTADLGAPRCSEELPRQSAARSCQVASIEPVRDTCDLRAVRGDPQPSLAVEGHVIRTTEPAAWRSLRMIAGAGILVRLATRHQDCPCPLGRGMISIPGCNLKDVTVIILGTGVCPIDLFGFARTIIAQHYIDTAIDLVGFDVLRPVHGGRLHKIGSTTSTDYNIA